MSLSSTFNTLGQSVMPRICAATMPDTCTIQGTTETSDSGGGYYVASSDNDYTSVPCSYEPITGTRFDSAGKLLSTELYRVTLPTHTSAGTRINLDPKEHRIVVTARGNEPAKTFRIVSIADVSGVVFEVTAEKEN